MISRSCANLFVLMAVIAANAVVAFGQSVSPPGITLLVDESLAPQRIAFVHEEIRVRAGALSLSYPKWIPGEHGPTGPIQQFADLRIHAGNATLPWTRDPEEIYTIHVDIPSGIDGITVDFDALLENTVSEHQFLLAWNTVVLYPRSAGKRDFDLEVQPSILLPMGWKQGSSLRVIGENGNRVNFAPLSLERLIDSPVLAGEFFRTVPLKSEWPAELDISGESRASVDKANDAHAFDIFGRLIDQDRAMFGFRHWEKMHILISQSEAVPFDGLEHEDSPYNAMADAALSKKDELEKVGWPLLAHEQSHSWCGKYRRPAELYSKTDYQGPERTSLLWVYEGLNEYIGMLLATRAGFNDAGYMRDYLARTTADLVHETARASTPLVDTATEDWVLRGVKGGWDPVRRRQDYYDEGALIWLRADVLIREQSHGRLSLDDFLRAFLGQRDTGPVVVPYTREDVEASLSAVLPYDWHNFFETLVYQVNSKPPTDGLEASGWRLIYTDEPNRPVFFEETAGTGSDDAAYSIGLNVKKDGKISEVWPGTPAYDAGLGPQMTIIAVDGRVFSKDILDEAIAHPEKGKIVLIVRNFDSVKCAEVKYAGGIRHPHLERIPQAHDYLTEILSPRENHQ